MRNRNVPRLPGDPRLMFNAAEVGVNITANRRHPSGARVV